MSRLHWNGYFLLISVITSRIRSTHCVALAGLDSGKGAVAEPDVGSGAPNSGSGLGSVSIRRQDQASETHVRGRHRHLTTRQPSGSNSLVDAGQPSANVSDGGQLKNEVSLRRELRQKRRKLKRLWQEIERIQRMLKLTPSVDTGQSRNSLGFDVDENKARSKGKKNHWRRRMMQRLKLLSRQLQDQQRSTSGDVVEKLYALLTSELVDGRKNVGHRKHAKNERHHSVRPKTWSGQAQRGRHHSTNSTVVGGLATVAPSKVGNPNSGRGRHGRPKPQKTRPNGTTGAFHVARVGVKKGEAGSACTSHKNCKPGFCCHQSSSSVIANASSSVCVDHRLKQSQPCANSCQCDSGLQCFISRKDKMYHKRVPPPDSSNSWSLQRDEGSEDPMVVDDGQCKVPAMDDVLHGVYIIGDSGVFKP